MIYILGDSHSCVFTINDNTNYINNLNKLYFKNVFASFRTKPYTCYNLLNKINLINNNLKQLSIKDNDYLFFCYGEVDIRCHIGFHITDKITLEMIIKETIERYIKFLLYYKSKYKNVGIYAPIASGSNNCIQGNGRPSYKTELERNKITKIFNNILEDYCKKHDILFKSISSDLMNDDNTTKNIFYSDDGTHLNIHAQSLLEDKFSNLIINDSK